MLQEFLERMKSQELNHKTYLLSRRRVVITNILNQKVLPSIGDKPKLISTPLAPVLHMTHCGLPFVDPSQHQDVGHDVVPVVSENHPSDQYQAYTGDPQTYTESESDRISKLPTPLLPVDQTIFAIQYSVDPKQYLQAIDVFTSIDDNRTLGAVLLAKKDVPTLHLKE